MEAIVLIRIEQTTIALGPRVDDDPMSLLLDGKGFLGVETHCLAR